MDDGHTVYGRGTKAEGGQKRREGVYVNKR